MRLLGRLATALAALLLGACSLFARPAAFCGPMDAAALGSVQLDYGGVSGTPSVSAAEAEAAARTIAGLTDSVTTCSVRLAHYRNLSVDVERVWVVHVDGLTWTALGGGFRAPGAAPASPQTLRRALFIVTGDAPAKVLLSVA